MMFLEVALGNRLRRNAWSSERIATTHTCDKKGW